jgi:hypothetical protein
MSTLITDSLLATSASNWTINLPSGNYINAPGHVLQTQWVRTAIQTTYGVAVTGDGTTIGALAITITPRSASSLLICSWMINYEVGENAGFLVHKNGALITTPGYQAYNNVVGNLRYSGVMNAMYDADNSSTLSNGYMQYAVPSGSTATATYAPAVRGSGASALTLYLNRTVGSAGQDDFEVTVSTGVIMEIAQ